MTHAHWSDDMHARNTSWSQLNVGSMFSFEVHIRHM